MVRMLLGFSITLFLIGSYKNLLRTLEREASVPEEYTSSFIKTYKKVYHEAGIDTTFFWVVFGQYTWETDFGRSKIRRENNNLFGMRHNNRGFSEGPLNKHASYSSPLLSLKDYGAWQKRMLAARPDVKTEEDYLNMLDDYNVRWCPDCRYAEDLTYTTKIRARIKLLKELSGD